MEGIRQDCREKLTNTIKADGMAANSNGLMRHKTKLSELSAMYFVSALSLGPWLNAEGG